MVSAASRTGRDLQRYDNGCRQVVGCIPYRYSDGGTLVEEMEVLLISSQKSERMMFPKGGWETDEYIEAAAKRETIEEAGVDGDLGCYLGSWKFKSKSQGTIHEGHMFPLLVKQELDVWPEKDVRQRIWMTVNKAREVCFHGWMKEALDIFVAQKEEEANKKPCSSESLTEEPRLGIVWPKSSKKEESVQDLFHGMFLRSEESIIGVVVQKQEKKGENQKPWLSEILSQRTGFCFSTSKQHKKEENRCQDPLIVTLLVDGKSTPTWRFKLPAKRKQIAA